MANAATRELVIDARALVEVVKYLSQYANDAMPKHRWKEAFGFLLCEVDDAAREYRVRKAVGVTAGHAVGVELAPEDLAVVEALQEENPSLFVGGWCHSHPGLGLFFSEIDAENHVFWQQHNPDAVGLVFDHTLVNDAFLGLKAFRLRDQERMEPVEVPFIVRGLTVDHLADAFSNFGLSTNFARRLLVNLHQAGTLKQAPLDPLSALQERLNRDPTDVDGWRELGKMAWERQNFDLTFKAFQQVNALAGGSDLEALVYVYLVQVKTGDEIIARDSFHKLVPLLGNDLNAWVQLGEQLAKVGDHAGAINCYIQAIRINPTDVSLVARVRELSAQQAEWARRMA
ncbi:MAG: hypothetical protein Kow0069_10570 [Promethearchaeota archaeon]